MDETTPEDDAAQHAPHDAAPEDVEASSTTSEDEAAPEDLPCGAGAEGQDAVEVPAPDTGPADEALEATPARSRLRSALAYLPLALPVVMVTAFGWQRRWMSDDGFIYLRVAKQIAAGNGPVFNAGERVEAATSVLWVWALAGLHALTGIRLEYTALFLGLVCTAAAFALVQAASVRVWRGPDPTTRVWLPATALVLACWAPMWDFATSGLETPLALVWIAAAFFVLTRHTTTRLRPLALEALVIALAWLVRPDLAVMAAVVAGAWLVARRSVGVGRLSLAVSLGAAPVLAYQLFRMAYFAALAPNPALAKEAGQLRISRGLTYLADAGNGYQLWLVVLASLAALVALTVSRRGKQLSAAWVMVGAGAAHLAYVAAVGGDFMHARLAIPGVFALLCALAAAPATRVGTAFAAACLSVAVTLAAVGRPVLEVPPAQVPLATTDTGVADERAFYVEQTGLSHPIAAEQISRGPGNYSRLTQAAIELRARARDGQREAFTWTGEGVEFLPAQLTRHWDTAMTTGIVGLPAFVSDEGTYIADFLGLADPVVARTRIVAPERPGHEKGASFAWGAAMMGLPAGTKGLEPTYAEEVAATTAALRCGWADELVETLRSPWSPSVAWRSLTHAPSWWSARVSPDPATAEIELCGRPAG